MSITSRAELPLKSCLSEVIVTGGTFTTAARAGVNAARRARAAARDARRGVPVGMGELLHGCFRRPAAAPSLAHVQWPGLARNRRPAPGASPFPDPGSRRLARCGRG